MSFLDLGCPLRHATAGHCVFAAICDAVGEDNSHCSNQILKLLQLELRDGTKSYCSSFRSLPYGVNANETVVFFSKK